MRIESLTEEQEKQMIDFREEWRNHGISCDRVDKDLTKRSITKMYELLGKKPPTFIFCPSLIFTRFQIAYVRTIFENDLRHNLRANLWDNLWANLRDNLGENIRENLRANLRDNLRANLWDNLWDNLRANLGANLWDNLRENLRANLWDNLGANLGANLWANLRANLGENLRENLRANLWDNLKDNLGANLWDNLRANLWDNLGANLWDNLGENIRHESTVTYGSMDAYWIAFYEFPEKFLGVEYDSNDSMKLKLWSDLAKSCSWFWCYENYCFVSDRPQSIHFDNQWRLHSENKPAITWIDGWELFYWKGVEVPKKLILNPESIDKKDLSHNQNAEVRRAFIEKLGVKKYYDILSNGKGLTLVDSDIDHQGNPMELFEFDFEGRKIQMLQCVCPSTDRVYNIPPPSQKQGKYFSNVFEAKEDTFKGEKLTYRHGDVGLVDTEVVSEKPLIET